MDESVTFRRFKRDHKPAEGAPRREAGRYLPSEDLVVAVNTALAVEQPLLITGEPGTGKTSLAFAVAEQLGAGKVLEFYTRSDHQARDLLYKFDNLRRFYDAHRNDARAEEPRNYRTLVALGEAIAATAAPRVVLIDEIDKAPRDFPNDLLNVMDRMEFDIPETGEHHAAVHRPIVIITSNTERQLPDPFLRRCVYHHLRFPTRQELRDIVTERVARAKNYEDLVDQALDRFLQLRETNRQDWEKLPATGELLVWVRVLVKAAQDAERSQFGHRPDPLAEELPFAGVLVKTQRDLERLALARRAPRA